MPGVVADTHALVWYLIGSDRLSRPATQALEQAIAERDAMYVSAISLVEILYLTEKGRLPEETLELLEGAIEQPHAALSVVTLTLGVVRAVKRIPRDVVPDMPDRIIAATALYLEVPLVTRDRRIASTSLTTIS